MFKNTLKIKPLHHRHLKRVTKKELRRSFFESKGIRYRDVYFIIDKDGDYEVHEKDDDCLLFYIWNHNT